MAEENGDHEMADATAGASVNGSEGTGYRKEKNRLRVVRNQPAVRLHAEYLMCFQLQGSTDSAASFAFEREDHTLGNALRYLITKKYDLPLQPPQQRMTGADC